MYEREALVSVIIPTKNSAQILESVLISIKKQTYRHIEIIVVDNNSADNTKKLAKKYTTQLYNQGPERSAQKNFGAAQSSGKYFLFLDSDAALTEGVIAECVALGEEGYDMVIIPERHQGVGFWSHAKALERQCYLGDDTIEAPWFFRKTSFSEVNGYDETMFAGEDWDIFYRLKEEGRRYARCNAFINHQLGEIKFFDYLKKKRYYGQNISIFISHHTSKSFTKLPFFRTAYIKHWKLLATHPLLTLGFFILKIGEMISVLIGMGKGKIRQQYGNN